MSGLGGGMGGSGMQFRTRRPQDAEAFNQEFTSRKGRGKGGRWVSIVALVGAVLVLAIWGIAALVG